MIENYLESIYRMNHELVVHIQSGAQPIDNQEINFLLDLYEELQRQRVRQNNRIKAHERERPEENPLEAMIWTHGQINLLEKQIKTIIQSFLEAHPMAWFFDQIKGVTGFTAARLLCSLDVHKAKNVGGFWRYAGIDPSSTWSKKCARPWNPKVKLACWKIGNQLVKSEGGCYRAIYDERKAYEWNKNLEGKNVEIAQKMTKVFDPNTLAYSWYSGEFDVEKVKRALLERTLPGILTCTAKKRSDGLPMLPPAQIHARARRYMVKVLLAHLHYRWHEQEFGRPPTRPLVLSHFGHDKYLIPPQIKP